MNKKNLLLAVLVAAIVFPVFASGKIEDESDAEVRTFVSVLPQKYFVETIGGSRVSVNVMVQPGRNPATYEPTPNQVASLSRADLFFTIGVPFENVFLPAISGSLKSLKIIDTSVGVEKRFLAAHQHDEDDHGAELQGSVDPHIWLSPILAKKQADNIFQALVAIDPEGEELYRNGLIDLKTELDELDAKIRTMLSPFAGSTLFIFHPTLGYFADEYNLKQVAIESGGKEPSPAELEWVIKYARENGVKIVFVQPEFSEASAKVIADAIGGSVMKLNPLNPEYIESLTEIAEQIRRSYE